MEIWRDREYVIWCGVCDWQVEAYGDDVTRYQESGCPECGAHDFGMRERETGETGKAAVDESETHWHKRACEAASDVAIMVVAMRNLLAAIEGAQKRGYLSRNAMLVLNDAGARARRAKEEVESKWQLAPAGGGGQ